MSVDNVCRLCLAKDNLVWIFDKRFESSENMKDVVYITTGVEIDMKDIITQKICDKCCQVTIKMFEFRRTSLKNDIYLREQCKRHLMKNNVKIPNTDVRIKYESHEIKEEPKQINDKPVFKIHPSVRELFKIYPQIRLPTVCLKSHIAPVVSMPMDGVENYFKTRNLDFNLYTKLALKSAKVATKRTSAPVKFKEAPATSSNSSETKGKSVIYSSHVKANSSNKSVDNINDKINTTVKSKPQSNLNLSNKDSVVNNFTKPNFSKDLTPEKTLVDKKRKFSEIETSSNKGNTKKPAFVELLGLTPNLSNVPPAANLESPAYVANVSQALHICDICNSVQYSAKDLRKHQNKHLRCQFCKTKFRNLETKNDHVEYRCPIKNIMNNLPDVVLKKIEYNRKVRRKYPDVFADFPPIKDVIDSSPGDNNSEHSNSSIRSTNSTNNSSSDKKPKFIKGSEKSSLEPPKNSISGSKDTTEIIEILSDDEDTLTTTTSGHTGTNASDRLFKKAFLKTNFSNNSDQITSKDTVATTSTGLPPDVSTSTPYPLITSIPQENPVYNTVSIVKPDIRIKGNCILDTVDPKLSDIKLLKELLNLYMPLALSAEKDSQTELPTNDSISIINNSDATTELRNLKQHMYVYKIPIIIKNGLFNVSYNYHTEAKQPRKLCLWNDLTPVDIKNNSAGVSNSNTKEQTIENKSLENNNYSILPSTATYYSSGFYSPAQTANISQCAPVIDTSIKSSSNNSCIAANMTNTSNNNSCTAPGVGIISTNPLLNNYLETQPSSASIEQAVTTVTVPTSSVSNAPPLTSPKPISTIRVKNMWEESTKIPTGNSCITASTSIISNNNTCTIPGTSITSTNPLLHNLVETQNSSAHKEQSTTTAVVPTSSTSNSAPLVNSISIGTIRVKNVWELT